MNVCRWCGANTRATAFCSPECATAAAEIPELVNHSAEALPVLSSPRRLASPKRSWMLGLLSGALLGVGAAMVATAPTAPQGPTRCGVGRAKAEVKAATLDFIQNGLAGIWDGRVDEAGDLEKWFVPGDATAVPMARIYNDQSRRHGANLLDAEVVDVRVTPTLDHADAEFFLQVEEGRGQRCYTGTFQWAVQENGDWLRTKVSVLRGTPCQ